MKPVGLGACCVVCGERRRATLRQFELHSLWVVLCHNCAVRAEAITPPPRSLESLQIKLQRERRWSMRRAHSGNTCQRPAVEQRRTQRRTPVSETPETTTENVNEVMFEIISEEAAPPQDSQEFDAPATMIQVSENTHEKIDPLLLNQPFSRGREKHEAPN